MMMNLPFLQPFWGAFKSPRQSSSTATRLLFFILILVRVIPLASGEANCTCKPGGEEDTNKGKTNKALNYKVAAIASILVAGAIGVCLPVAGRTVPALSPDKDVFFLIKAFAAGVILATGFIHVLPDAFDHLTSPCLTEKVEAFKSFSFTGFVAMMSAIVTLMIDAFASTYFAAAAAGNNADNDDEGGLHTHTQANHGHAHGSAAILASRHSSNSKDLIRHRVIAQVLELGIVVHSVIIGISLGASESPGEIKPLVVALSFHQFFEGMGLGGCITQAKFKRRAVVIMALFFSLTTPVGIAIGIALTKSYDEDSKTALIVEGTLNAASAGILIYMALVDLLGDDFMNPKMQTNRKLQLGANASLLLGAGLMALLAKWA